MYVIYGSFIVYCTLEADILNYAAANDDVDDNDDDGILLTIFLYVFHIAIL